MKDKELKREEIEVSHTLDGEGEGRTTWSRGSFRGEGRGEGVVFFKVLLCI